MENICRTVYGALLQTAQLMKLPITLKPHTTLNEKFNIHSGIAIADTDIPGLKYATIGNGGHKMAAGADGIPVPDMVQHLPRHSGLYNHLPFVLREPNNDLTSVERSRYRLRRMETHNGKTYVAYYLKVLDLSATIPQMDYKTVVDGSTYSTPFEPNNSDLNPTPPDLSDMGAVTTTGDYISATAKVPFTMTETDVAELLNVSNIIYQTEKKAIISEIGLCSGIDRAVMGDFNGVSSSYTDAIGVQIVSFLSVFYAMQFNNSGINMNLDVGSVESLLVLS